MTPRGLLAGLAMSLGVLSGCGEATPASTEDTTAGSVDSSPAASADPEPTEPQCDAVWVRDQRLPRQYDGCYDGSTKVDAERTPCSFGRPLVTYAGRFYAVPTGTIHEVDGSLKRDEGYRSALKSCMA